MVKSIYNVEKYWCSLDMPRDVESFLWRSSYSSPSKQVRGIGLKPVYPRYDSQCCVHCASLWLSDMVPAFINTLRDLTKTLKRFIFLPQHKTYKLFDNIIEGAWQWPIYLFFIFCFKCANVDYIFVPLADKQVPRRDCYKSYMSKLKFSNIVWNILWQSNQAHTKWIMEITKAQSEYGIRYILVVWTRVNFQSPGT